MEIASIGAGNVVFTEGVLTDTFSSPELRGATFALHDIDSERLETAGMMARWTSGQLEADAKIEDQPDRRAALEGRRDHVHDVALLDRHAASVLSLDTISAMMDELVEAHGDALPEGVRVPVKKTA